MIIKNTINSLSKAKQSYTFIINYFYKQYFKFLQQILYLIINKNLLVEVRMLNKILFFVHFRKILTIFFDECAFP